MRRCWESESDHIVLECHCCEEIIILLGREEDWYTEEGYICFECQCGQRLTISTELR
jgi:hypothetical protein